MSKALYIPLKLSLGTALCLSASPLLAQVTSDSTVNTQVTQNGNIAEITGGETRGSNLFHSFQDFSVQTGNEAFFNNADSISNIFSRVTGGNISNIDGAIRANGSASLFLINPAGIIFGENSSLNIGGSFYGSTASSILFEDGEFSAVDNLQEPILTVNAPIGLGFRDEPGDIINRASTGNSLEVSPGETIALLGGNVTFDGGGIFAPGANVEIGGLTEAGEISIAEDNTLRFPDSVARGNVLLTNTSNLNVPGEGGVTINARDFEINTNSAIRTGGKLRRIYIALTKSPLFFY
ncbi:filamentous hemagglutinin N-terminal domain-containing protein, partial [Waterburya agarophytonicola K14]